MMGDFFPKNVLDFEDFEAQNSPGIFDVKIKGENLGSKIWEESTLSWFFTLLQLV